jgi:hypothetical protein
MDLLYALNYELLVMMQCSVQHSMTVLSLLPKHPCFSRVQLNWGKPVEFWQQVLLSLRLTVCTLSENKI